MKCPQCGDDMVNGRCVFCGYRPTESDRQAYARWAEQKKKAEGGFPELEPERRPKAEKCASRQPGAGQQRERTPRAERQAPKAGKPERQRKSGRKRPSGPRQRDGPGFFGRLVPRLVVILWALLIIYLMVSELAVTAPG